MDARSRWAADGADNSFRQYRLRSFLKRGHPSCPPRLQETGRGGGGRMGGGIGEGWVAQWPNEVLTLWLYCCMDHWQLERTDSVFAFSKVSPQVCCCFSPGFETLQYPPRITTNHTAALSPVCFHCGCRNISIWLHDCVHPCVRRPGSPEPVARSGV